MDKLRRSLTLTLVVIILLPLVLPGASRAQDVDDKVAQLMAEMSSAEKVGQLFLVTFPGSELTIYRICFLNYSLNYSTNNIVI